MEQIGQYRNFGALWLALALKRATSHAGLWPVVLPGVVDQMTGQMAPVSMMDQGPIVTAGVPALGIAGRKPIGDLEKHYRLWHDPSDTLEYQSASTVGNIGLVAESLIRQLQSMQSFPQKSGPYLYNKSSNQVLGLAFVAGLHWLPALFSWAAF